MYGANSLFKGLRGQILAMMLVLFAVTALVVSFLNQFNLRGIYEKNFTQRVLLTNNLIATLVNGEDIKHYVDLMKNGDDDFKKSQVQFYNDREELFSLQGRSESRELQKTLMDLMSSFHDDMNKLKSSQYWTVVRNLRQLKEVSQSKYVYVFADTGVTATDGTKLYTYIFDAEDSSVYDRSDSDGLGTVNTFDEIVEEIYKTKKPMDTVMYYNGNYGELYYAYAPVLDNEGNVIAILGTDVDLGEMHQEIQKSMILFTIVFLSFVIIIILSIYVFVNRNITGPLGELTSTARKLADGDVYTFVPPTALTQESEIGILAHAVNDMSGIYQNMIKSTEELFDATRIGRLDVRNDASKYKGDIKRVIEQINDTLDAMIMYLNSVPEGISIMSKDFKMYFRNEQCVKFFGAITASEFIANILPHDPNDSGMVSREEQFAAFLNKPNNTTTLWMNEHCFSITIKEINLSGLIENSVMAIAIDITDLMREKENAQAATKAKSDFLSRMSHEMRTPMNAIIGMTKIADSTDDMSKLRHCLSTIDNSSKLLLGIINDVLDMSKIEAGKFELENVPMNIEKMLINICNIVGENIEKKQLRFNVILGKNMELNFIADDLRLSQVITNLLSNAVKFTPEKGKITITVEEISRLDNFCTLRFSVADTGIGMTGEQIGRLFTSFEQADGSITRRFGGTGLGLAISKNIVEKMGGTIWVESEYGSGSTFIFEAKLELAAGGDKAAVNKTLAPNLRLLLVESDMDIRDRFLSIIEDFGIEGADSAASSGEAVNLVDSAFNATRAYDKIFVDYNMPDMNGLDIVKQLDNKIDPDTVTLITSFLEWHRIENGAHAINIGRYITKPLFPSAVFAAINGSTTVTGPEMPEAGKAAPAVVPDFSSLHILLAEDVEINREIFIALLDDTGLSIDTAENGLVAVSKFRKEPLKYDLIIMDIQMPEMDGYGATRAIRDLDIPRAVSIPIIAMTANAFKEDIERCLATGMNDHLSKPIDKAAIIGKIKHYAKPHP